MKNSEAKCWSEGVKETETPWRLTAVWKGALGKLVSLMCIKITWEPVDRADSQLPPLEILSKLGGCPGTTQNCPAVSAHGLSYAEAQKAP